MTIHAWSQVRFAVSGAFVGLLIGAVAQGAQVKGSPGGTPGFSGVWTLDPAKSDPPPAGRGGGGGNASGTQTISQTPTEFSVTTEGRGGPQTMTYRLDGSESTNQVQGRGGPQIVKSKASWDGTNLIIETTRDFQGTAITTKEVRKLDPTGKEMTVEATVSGPQGSTTRKTVYTKGS